MKLDILAIGVHPDDVELGCAGTLLSEMALGKKAGIIDLTKGELGTRGSADIRDQEAARAAQILGVSVRENLAMRDGFFKNDEEHQLALIRTIRKYRPEIVLANIKDDRHPDHGRAGKLIADACFLSGLAKIKTADDGLDQERWRPKYVLHYLQDWYHEPSLLVDITAVFEQKMRAILAYTSQFHVQDGVQEGLQTYISTPDFLESVTARSRMMGKRIGVKYAEAFVSEKNIGIRSLDALLQVET